MSTWCTYDSALADACGGVGDQSARVLRPLLDDAEQQPAAERVVRRVHLEAAVDAKVARAPHALARAARRRRAPGS
jgi:hypothetical protein